LAFGDGASALSAALICASFFRPNGIGEKAEMTDAPESLGQHVLEKSAHEL
jgi:hypothetical protein